MFSERLRQLRQEKKMTQVALGQAVDISFPPVFNTSRPICAPKGTEVQAIPRRAYTTLRRGEDRFMILSHIFRIMAVRGFL